MSTGTRSARALLTSVALIAALVVVGCGSTKSDESSTSSSSGTASSDSGKANPNAPIKQGLKTVSIPKQLGNPYEEFEHSGVEEALKELGGADRSRARPTPARRRRFRSSTPPSSRRPTRSSSRVTIPTP